MKALHVITSLGYGGAERLLVELLPTLREHGVEPSVVSLSSTIPLAVALEEAGIRVVTSLGAPGTIYHVDRCLRAARQLRTLVDDLGPEIVHSHLYMADLIARVAVRARGPKLFTTLHNEDAWWGERWRVRSRLKTSLDRFSARHSRVHFIAVSEGVRQAAMRSLGLTDAQTRVVHNGIRLSRFRPKPAPGELRAPIIIQVGRFFSQKGHAVSVEALAVLRRTHPEAQLWLVGDGPLLGTIRQMVESLALTEAVAFLGRRDDVPQLLARADLCWMPSEYEGLGIACIEAMASGLPVVGTDVTGLREVIVHGETGFLVPKASPEDLAAGTRAILEDRALWIRMATNGRQRAEQFFSVEATARAYSRAYHDALEGSW